LLFEPLNRPDRIAVHPGEEADGSDNRGRQDVLRGRFGELLLNDQRCKAEQARENADHGERQECQELRQFQDAVHNLQDVAPPVLHYHLAMS
jgi:hypothetical protein